MASEWSMTTEEVDDEYNTLLLVHGIHPGLTKEGLKGQFIRFGDVESVNVMVNSRGNPMGFVQMKTVRDCAAAISGLNGRAPLHWMVTLSAPRAERERRRRERDEIRRFNEEMRPIHEAKLKELEEHEQKMRKLTCEFVGMLEHEKDQQIEDTFDGHAGEKSVILGRTEWPETDDPGCTTCGAPTPRYCQNCRAPYCSSACQTADWDRHKHHCRPAGRSLVVSVDACDGGESVRSVRMGGGDTAGSQITSAADIQQHQQHHQQHQQQQQQQQLGAVSLQAGHNYPVVVCYAADPSAVYLRLRDQSHLVAAMEAELQRQVTPPALPGTFQVGDLCAALFDGEWCRAEVRSVAASHYTVHFLDWGNVCRVSARELAPLPAALSDVPPQAVHAALPWRPAGPDGGWSERQWRALAALDGQQLTAAVLDRHDRPGQACVALFNADGKSVLSLMAETEGSTGAVPPAVTLDRDRKYVVRPSGLVHPQHVTAQVRDPAVYRPYCALTDRLQTASRTASPLESVPAVGTAVSVLCAAVSGAAAVWHRAAVQGSDGRGRARVTLLDWGCQQLVEPQQMRLLPPDLCQATAIGIQFGLSGVSESECPEQDLDFFRQKLISRDFLLEQTAVTAGVIQARLHLISDTNSYCFNDKMLARIAKLREARPVLSPPAAVLTSDQQTPLLVSDLPEPPLTAGDCHPFVMGPVLSARRFFGTLLTEESAAAAERVETQLRTGPPPAACSRPPCFGQLLLARSRQAAGGWCRAAVLDAAGPEVEVRLVDLGHQERVPLDRLRLMPPQLANSPAGAIALSLKGSERFSVAQRRTAEKLLSADGEERLLELTVVTVGRRGAPTVVTCAEIDQAIRS